MTGDDNKVTMNEMVVRVLPRPMQCANTQPTPESACLDAFSTDKTGQGSIRHACQHNVEIGLELD